MSLLFFQFYWLCFLCWMCLAVLKSSVESYKSEEETIDALGKCYKKTLAKKEGFVIYLIFFDEWNPYDICSWNLQLIFYFKKIKAVFAIFIFLLFLSYLWLAQKRKQKNSIFEGVNIFHWILFISSQIIETYL